VNRTSILLHTCCAPCATSVVERLAPSYDVTLFFENSNISSRKEYNKRLDEAFRFSKITGVQLIEGPYDPVPWFERVRTIRFLGEGSERCAECIAFRLRNTFTAAQMSGFSLVASTLSVSPRKNTEIINLAGSGLETETGISFLKDNFKKQGGYQRSIELSKLHGLYRQNYCGCVYSKLERDSNFSWEPIRRKYRQPDNS
jgi:predicted adenine nucleotide alpha hydrolase (AANH) superfamily ATPase